MNRNIVRGKWRELRGGFKKQWGRLTDDDVSRIQGSLDQILGVIQKRYGYTQDRVEHELGDYFDAYSQRMRSYGAQARGYNEEMQDRVRSAVDKASSKARPKKGPAIGRVEDVSGGSAWMAIAAGLALLGVVLYLFNRPESY